MAFVSLPRMKEPAVGLYGKIPAERDFVRINAGDFQQAGLDQWFAEGIECLHTERLRPARRGRALRSGGPDRRRLRGRLPAGPGRGRPQLSARHLRAARGAQADRRHAAFLVGLRPLLRGRDHGRRGGARAVGPGPRGAGRLAQADPRAERAVAAARRALGRVRASSSCAWPSAASTRVAPTRFPRWPWRASRR